MVLVPDRKVFRFRCSRSLPVSSADCSRPRPPLAFHIQRIANSELSRESVLAAQPNPHHRAIRVS